MNNQLGVELQIPPSPKYGSTPKGDVFPISILSPFTHLLPPEAFQ
ncbi:hypothetical protein Aoki45_14120 [Algoriphagus sp. oki45]|nr:hypothetical protein Aoki45_14120 [Algoriphagus sp. oki45]